MSRPAVSTYPDHRDHDRLLVVRLVTGDVGPAEARTARAQLDSCTDCAALAEDVRTLSIAVATQPIPRRPRDFRLSVEQAREARGSFLARILRRLALPQSAVLQPLAGAAVAIGLVLVVVGSSLPGPVPAAPAGAGQPAAADTTVADAGESGRGPTGDIEAGGASPGGPPAAAEPSVVAGGVPSKAAATSQSLSEPVGSVSPTEFATSSPSAASSADGDLRFGTDTETGMAGGGSEGNPPAGQASTTTSSNDPLVVIGGSVAGAGILLLLLSLYARRRPADPALR